MASIKTKQKQKLNTASEDQLFICSNQLWRSINIQFWFVPSLQIHLKENGIHWKETKTKIKHHFWRPTFHMLITNSEEALISNLRFFLLCKFILKKRAAIKNKQKQKLNTTSEDQLFICSKLTLKKHSYRILLILGLFDLSRYVI